jgi:hypothetical protein
MHACCCKIIYNAQLRNSAQRINVDEDKTNVAWSFRVLGGLGQPALRL